MKSLETVADTLWQHPPVQRLELEQQLAYWKQHLADLPGALALPVDHARAAGQAFEGGWYRFPVPSSLAQALARLGRRADASLSLTLLTAFQVWLCRHSNQEDLLVGTVLLEPPADAGGQPLVIRARLADNPRFGEALRRVRAATSQARLCQDVSLAQITAAVLPADEAEAALFQVMFQCRRQAAGGAPNSDLEYGLADVSSDLTLSLVHRDGAFMEAGFFYNARLFDAATMQRFARRFLCLLVSIVAQPDERIWQLSLLPEEERAQLAAANATGREIAPAARGQCLHQFFEAQVARTPSEPALVVNGETLSYAQLNRRANLLARRLRQLGVGPEVLVGLCLPRTVDLPVALLAILKAGGAYVPLDPAYPAERLRFQIQDSGAHLLLTVSSLEPLWQGIAVRRLVLDRLDPEVQGAEEQEVANPESQVREDHLAYVIYTSGSTGLPKGVCIAHRNAMALVHWGLRLYSLDDVRGMVAGTSICFDLSIFEFFVPWSCGGAIYLVDNGLHLPEGEARERVTLLNMVPSVMAELMRTTALPASLRVVTFCGETLPRPLVERLYALPGLQRIYNLYGPTEDTTYSTWALLDRQEHGENVPIGCPLDNSQVYLLDRYGQQVPPGVIGEIYLGGAGVARGYWNRPDLTAQRFVPDGFGARSGAHLYRSGDHARYRADGQLEFLGRMDQQVKIRGHRIELGEIESVLRQYPGVQDGVVLARKLATSSTHALLVAYVVPTVAQSNPEEALRAFLLERLPEYMLPSFFVLLPALPRTSNGKIDRKALPDPRAGKERKAPRAAQTKLLAALNLSAGKKELFKRLLHKEAPASAQPAPEEAKDREWFPLAFSQQRYWLIDRLDPGTPAYNIFFGEEGSGNLNIGALMRALHEIVRRHETLRTVFLEMDGTPMQRICPPSPFPIPIIDLRERSLEEQQSETRRLLKEELAASFDLHQGLLLRASVILLAEHAFIVMLNMHHIASDGWSTEIFREELGALYEAFSHGRPSPLPALPIRYMDYVLWQQQKLQGPLLERQLAYWKQQLANLPGPLVLPTDRPRPARQTINGGIYRFMLPAGLPQALQDLGQDEGVTLFMTLYAIFHILLCRLSGQEDVLVGTPIANRTRTDFGKLIGCFVNSVVFRPDLAGNPSFRAFLQRIRAVALGAYNHQDIPFEQVLHAIRLERDSAYTYAPLFQVMFHFQPLVIMPVRQVKLNVEHLKEKNIAAKFDLSLRMKVEESEEGMGLSGEFLFNTDLFDHSTMARFAARLIHLCEGVVAQPDQQIWQLPLLPAEERALLATWNPPWQGTLADGQASVQQLFEAQVARTPGASALVAEGEALSYAQLNRRANQLAQRLRSLGVGPEVPVALGLAPGACAIIALLAVLKAGGVAVPLAVPEAPARLAQLLDETQAALLITAPGHVVVGQSVQVLSLDAQQWATLARESTENPACEVRAEQCALVLYPAGSAGVVIEQCQVLHATQAQARGLGMEPGCRVAPLGPLSAASSLMVIYATLCTGGTLHLVPQAVSSDALALADYIRQGALDYLSIESAQLALFAATSDVALARRALLINGRVSWERLCEFKAAQPATAIYYQYGSAETTAGVTLCLVEPDQGRVRPGVVPVGRPLAGSQVYILDQAQQQVPIDLPGELYMGGACVARGYLHAPRLTQERFVADPFSPGRAARLYRSGERARYLPDGTIELLVEPEEPAESVPVVVEVPGEPLAVVPQSEIEVKLIQIWENLLQLSPASAQDNFFDQGGNSLVAVRLMAQIKREFQQELPISVLFQKATPELLAVELLRRRWSGAHSALVGIQPTGTKPAFFCVHPVGGEVICYADLARQLGPEQPLYGLQAPWQTAAQTIEEMAGAYIAELQSVQPCGPYLLGGWSLGGVIAFEMAHQLRQQGQEVALLALFDSYAPTIRPQIRSLVEQFGRELEGAFDKRRCIDYTRLQDLAVSEQLIQLYTQAMLADLLPPDLELEQLQRMFAIYTRNVEALRQYRPSCYAGRLTLFPLRSPQNAGVDADLGWQALTRQEVDIHPLSGEHYTMLRKPHLERLVEQLRPCLEGAVRR
jgi:amino acid adenylation domain-containing protein